eukprot:TRINITY_DN286_c1_g1_i25.p1 TRINITY_DN286_c1_g1~~TRINITY_DN286_c1_g1_i25.p1  ORF type:complete len:123 (+),score=5.01 TRINITY_DN286_c1_g1_i25:7-375(+)
MGDEHVGQTIIQWGEPVASSCPSSLRSSVSSPHFIGCPSGASSFSQSSTHVIHLLSLAYGSEDGRDGRCFSRKLLLILTSSSIPSPSLKMFCLCALVLTHEVVGGCISSVIHPFIMLDHVLM